MRGPSRELPRRETRTGRPRARRRGILLLVAGLASCRASGPELRAPTGPSAPPPGEPSTLAEPAEPTDFGDPGQPGGAGTVPGPAAAQDATSLSIHGSLRTRYRYRATEEANDHDLDASLNLDVGDRRTDPFSGRLVLWSNFDLDENGKGDDPFFDLSDTYDNDLTARLYQAYVDVNQVESFELFRFGRQPLEETPEFVSFDGLRLETPERGDPHLRLGFYGGVPVHTFESSASGDLVLGTFVEARPWKGGRARIDYMHLEDELLLGQEQNDLLALGAWHASGRLRLSGEYSFLEGESRDLDARALWVDPRSDFTLRVGWFQLLETQRQRVTELDPFFDALHEYFPFYRAEVLASKGLGEHLRLEAGGELRRLVDSGDEGDFNREYERYHGRVELDRLLQQDLTLGLTGELWNDDNGDVGSWGLDLTREWEQDWRASLGSTFALYDLDPFTLDERQNVRVYSLDVRHRLSEQLRLDLTYEYEDDDLDTYHVLRGGVLWTF